MRGPDTRTPCRCDMGVGAVDVNLNLCNVSITVRATLQQLCTSERLHGIYTSNIYLSNPSVWRV